MKLILLGPPGAGKGTVSEALKEMGYAHLSTGNILRDHMARQTSLGIEAKKFIEKGELVPDEVVIGLIKEEIKGKENYILDGFPRTIPQAEAIQDVAIEKVILLDVAKELVVERFSGRRKCEAANHGYHVKYLPPKKEGICDVDGSKLIQRDDDKPEIVEKRFVEYMNKTAPLIEFYKEKGLLTTIDASPLPQEVIKSVKTLLEQ